MSMNVIIEQGKPCDDKSFFIKTLYNIGKGRMEPSLQLKITSLRKNFLKYQNFFNPKIIYLVIKPSILINALNSILSLLLDSL